MKNHVFSIFWLLVFSSQICTASFDYFDQKPPGKDFELFGPGIVSLEGLPEKSLTISPSGDELFFKCSPPWPRSKILHLKKENGKWGKAETAFFCEEFNATEPAFSPDGRFLYFSANIGRENKEDYCLFRIEKTSEGWSEPEVIGDNPDPNVFEFHPTVCRDGTVIYCRWDHTAQKGGLWFFKVGQGSISDPVMMDLPGFNDENNTDPFVDPEGRFLIFESRKPGGYGKADLYVSHRDEAGNWKRPVNLGPSFNSARNEQAFDLSPDGKYMFFYKKKEIYWKEFSKFESLTNTVYVDGVEGSDSGSGSSVSPFKTLERAMKVVRSDKNDVLRVKIAPGIYVLDDALRVETEKPLGDRRVVLESLINPDDPNWTLDQMPVILSVATQNLPKKNRAVGFLIESENVTIRGLRFSGYAYPNRIYFPVAKWNREVSDLVVEQCMFTAERNSSSIQVGVLAHGDRVKVDHCVFYGVNNTVVFFKPEKDDVDGLKEGNQFSNSIIYGASESGVWTGWPDKDLLFENNVVSNCERFWIKNHDNPTEYVVRGSVIVDNKVHLAESGPNGYVEISRGLIEEQVQKDGEVELRLIDNIFKPVPRDFLHLTPESAGHASGSGLFRD